MSSSPIPAPWPLSPEWLSLQQAALIYGVSVDTSDAESPTVTCPLHASAVASSGSGWTILTGSSGQFRPYDRSVRCGFER